MNLENRKIALVRCKIPPIVEITQNAFKTADMKKSCVSYDAELCPYGVWLRIERKQAFGQGGTVRECIIPFAMIETLELAPESAPLAVVAAQTSQSGVQVPAPEPLSAAHPGFVRRVPLQKTVVPLDPAATEPAPAVTAPVIPDAPAIPTPAPAPVTARAPRAPKVAPPNPYRTEKPTIPTPDLPAEPAKDEAA